MAAAINVKILGDATSLVRSFNKAERSASGFNRSMTKSGTSTRKSQGLMRGLGSSVRLAGGAFLGGAGIVAGITSTLKKTAEFERSMNTLQAVSGANKKEMASLGAQARKLGGDIGLPGTSAKDAAEAMTELAKSNLSVAQVQKSVRATLLLSAAAQIGNAQAAEITSNTLNAFGIKASRTSKVVDILANTANSSSLEIDDAALAFKQAQSVFASFQKPVLGSEGALKELAVATALMGNAGIKGSDAGTSLKVALLKLAAPTEQAKATMEALYFANHGVKLSEEELQSVMQGTAKERRKTIATLLKLHPALANSGDIAYDAAGKMRPFSKIMELAASSTKNMTAEQRNMALKTIFGTDAIRAAIVSITKQGTETDKMKASIDRNGSAQAIATAKQKGLAGAMDALKSSVESLQIAVGTVLAPSITKYLQASAKWLGDTKNQKTILSVLKSTLAGIATVLHVIRAAFHALSVVVGGNKNAVKALIGALIVLKVTMLGLGIAGRVAAFRALTGATRAATVATVAQGNASKGAAAKGALLRRSLIGKAGIVGAAGVAAFALTTLVLKVTGLDKKLKAAGGAAFDLAAKLGLANDKGKQFEGKSILGKDAKQSTAIRRQAARLEARGLSPKQAAARIALNRPNVARRDIDVLAGVLGHRPVVNIHIDGRRDDAETVARKTGEALRKHGKRNTTQRRGR